MHILLHASIPQPTDCLMGTILLFVQIFRDFFSCQKWAQEIDMLDVNIQIEYYPAVKRFVLFTKCPIAELRCARWIDLQEVKCPRYTNLSLLLSSFHDLISR